MARYSLARPTQGVRFSAQDTQTKNNQAPQLASAPAGSTLGPIKPGDLRTTITNTGVSITVGGGRNTSKRVLIPSGLDPSLAGYQPPQDGIVAPTVADNFPDDGDFGWYRDTVTGYVYWGWNDGGTLRNVTLTTLAGTLTDTQHGDRSTTTTTMHKFAQISGTITATQHSNFAADAANDSLHAEATAARYGFLSPTKWSLIDGAATAATPDTLVKRNGSGEVNATGYNISGSSTLWDSLTNATASATASTIVKRDASKDIYARRFYMDGASSFVMDSSGVRVVGPRRTGWGMPTGSTPLRTTFDTTTVTLEGLARRVYALIEDLSPTGHGLIDAS